MFFLYMLPYICFACLDVTIFYHVVCFVSFLSVCCLNVAMLSVLSCEMFYPHNFCFRVATPPDAGNRLPAPPPRRLRWSMHFWDLLWLWFGGVFCVFFVGFVFVFFCFLCGLFGFVFLLFFFVLFLLGFCFVFVCVLFCFFWGVG